MRSRMNSSPLDRESVSAEKILAAAHRDLTRIARICRMLEQAGIHRDVLPTESAQMAFAALGDHQREHLQARLGHEWAQLQEKAIVYKSIATASTAELRLIAHVLPYTKAIATIRDRLCDATDEPPHGVLSISGSIKGIWGQSARVHFVAKYCTHLLIEPDPIFCLQSSLIAGNPDGQTAGWMELPVENGQVSISLLHRSGSRYRRTISISNQEIGHAA